MFVKILNSWPMYPDSLQSLPGSPSVLYCRGSPALLLRGGVAVIGTRRPSSASISFVKDYISNLPKDTVVISGLALGTDRVAHATALECGLKTIAVLPSGVDVITPKSHQSLADEIISSGGLLVSEYPNGTLARKSSFVRRNRIVAGLADSVVVGECEAQSGTMHTVRFAHSYQKPIKVFDMNASGNQYIIDSMGGIPL